MRSFWVAPLVVAAVAGAGTYLAQRFTDLQSGAACAIGMGAAATVFFTVFWPRRQLP